MVREAKTDFNFERVALLGIEPMEPGKTFRLIRPDTYIGGEVAREILEMYPKRPNFLTRMTRLGSPVEVVKGQLALITTLFEKRSRIWMGVKDLTEITLHGLACTLPAALGGELAAGAGILLFATPSISRMIITGEFSLTPPSEATKTVIKLWLVELGSLGALAGLAGGISEARNYPFNRFIRFS